MEDCIFCSLANSDVGESPLYSDEDCIVIRDINPKAATHLLVIPKRHIPSVADITSADANLMGHLLFCAKKVADDLGLTGYKLVINVGSDGGQEIFHIHVHLLSNSAQ